MNRELNMSRCRLIVYERTGHWAAALRATGVSGLPRIVETRSLAACVGALDQSPRSLVALEISTLNDTAALDVLVAALRQHPQSAIVALLSPAAIGAEPLFREAGAMDVIRSVLDVPRLARLAARVAARAPAAELTLDQFITEALPWSGLATREWLAASS